MRSLLLALLLLAAAGCGLVLDNSPPDPNSSGDGGGSRIRCNADVDCDDGNPCNGVEACASDKYCIAGTAIMCPADGCFVGVCNPTDGTCSTVRFDGACDDGIACTDDVCQDDKTCTHEPINAACDDGIGCTDDLCLAAPTSGYAAGCVSRPNDTLCSQPGVANPCAYFVCAPAATNESSGCAIAPTQVYCGATQRCNLDTFQCEPLPIGCTGCADGNPCNGVESCDPLASIPVCTTSGGCGTTNDACTVAVCDTTHSAPVCSTAPSNSVSCVTPIAVP